MITTEEEATKSCCSVEDHLKVPGKGKCWVGTCGQGEETAAFRCELWLSLLLHARIDSTDVQMKEIDDKKQ